MAINSLSYSSNGYAGLVSGIDTESVVKEMLSGTQAKIDKAGQDKQTLLYKQSMYRDVATQLKTLQTSFMSFSSSTNLLSSSFYNQMTTSLRMPTAGQNAAFSVTATSSSTPGTYKLTSISQLATAHSIKTKNDVSGAVSGTLNADVAKNILNNYSGGDVPRDADLIIQVGNKSVTIDNAPEVLGGKSADEIVDILNAEFEAAGVEGNAAFVNNKLTIYANDSEDFIRVHGNFNADSQDSDLSMLMFGEGITDLSAQGTFSATIDSDLYLPSLTVELDGREQEIYLDFDALRSFAGVDADGNPVASGSDGGTALLASLQESLSRAFGTGVNVAMSGDTITFDTGSPSSTLMLTGTNTSMELFGLTSGISNKLNASLALDDLNFASPLQGSRHSFSINGVDFSYDSTTSLSTIINDINNSKAGVKIIYQEAEDKFTIQRAETGLTTADDPYAAIDMSQTEGNLLSALFGVEGGSDFTAHGINQVMNSAASVAASEYEYGGTYMFNVNGTNYTFTVPQKSGVNEKYTAEEFTEKLNESFRSSFGTLADGTQSIELTYDAGQFSITSNKESLVVKMPTGTVGSDVKSLGFADDASTQITDGSTTLSEAGIQFGAGGSITVQGSSGPISIDGSTLNGLTLDEVAAQLQNAIRTAEPTSSATVEFDKNTASFRILGIDIPMDIIIDGGTDGENTEDLFGSSHLQLHQAANADAVEVSYGTNAKVWIDGVELERSSNTFEYNNMSFTVHSLYNEGEGALGAPTEVVVERDTEVIAESLQEFLTAYNEAITMFNELYTADSTYKDYPPLTSEQMAGMSETEIENWEEKSKEGLLRMDDNLFSILESMRSAMYTRPLGSSIAIYDLGIDTSFYSEDGHFELSSEADLIAALEQDPEAVMNLFSGAGGIMETLNTAINDAVGATGYLTREAGINSLDVNSNIYKQVEDIDEQLLTLENRYWNEYDRYWSQFNAMESYIQQMNEQMSWLTSSLSSSGSTA